MKKIVYLLLLIMVYSCNSAEKAAVNEEDKFDYVIDQFADVRVLRYKIPGFDELSLNQKKLIYYLGEAALCGRDIICDQHYKYNLLIRKTLEAIYASFPGDKNTQDYKAFEEYLKRVWFSNGIHHHYSTDKFIPGFSKEYFEKLIDESDATLFPLSENGNLGKLKATIIPIIFDKNIAAKRVSQDSQRDLLLHSACNFYENVTQEEAEKYYKQMADPDDQQPLSYGLNSKLVKRNGELEEMVYKSDGLYGEAIIRIIQWLEKAMGVAENDLQKAWIAELIEYYRTGDLHTWDKYNILWVKDVESLVDAVNGFIETYGDPLGLKASWEGLVNFKNMEASQRTKIISDNAQWFENNSPIEDRFKKKSVKGVSAKVITVAQLGGDVYPYSPIGINLPNADWIRKEYGSKSVTLENITHAHYMASLNDGFYEEFLASEDELELIRKYGYLTDNLHTDLHECLGHGSGQLLPGTASDALKNYQSSLEESRADLFALYYMGDQKMIELGLLPDTMAYKAVYIDYIQRGLMTQLKRIQPGNNIEQAHMRCRQLIAKWAYENGREEGVIEKSVRDGKTYFSIRDFKRLRELFGELLKEVQRIKSEGDYDAGKKLVEHYAVKVDPKLHQEVLERYKKLNLAPFTGFINPVLVPVMENGEIVDIKVEHSQSFEEQMLYYSEKYSFLQGE